MEDKKDRQEWHDVLAFWFPEGRSLQVDHASHSEYWHWRMRGGADEEITARFSELTAAASAGKLNHWASDPEGRLALIIVLDQFSRSVWRESERAFAQDPAALELVIQGLSNGHYAALAMPWFRIVFGLPLGHCEGADHLARMNLLIGLRQDIAAQAPAHLQPIYQLLLEQAKEVREVITVFGRHPHRNQTLGRSSSLEEQAYIERGEFPHLRVFED